jgi:uncharacterized RDD family membrane protein YckC
MNAGFFRRLGAYLIDVIIIMIVVSLFSRFLPNSDKIDALNNANSNLLTDYSKILQEGDVDKINDFSALITDYNYELTKLSLYTNLSTIVLYILYFVGFQGYNNGQTVGKRLLKIEIVDDEDNNPNFKQLLIRGIILYPMVLSLLDTMLIHVLSKSSYISCSNVIAYIQYALYFVCFITVVFAGRGIHDKLAGTRVIKYGTVLEEDESNVSKWKKTAEKEKVTRTYRVNHTSGKRKE